ncbi:MAG: adenosylcobinamide amidohydrolase [Methanoregula sp.]|jgi:adenosylcobinamide hydrolase|uniref:adenosylcobinamide amidohydrolase n=1 Tax=Methanoregula sp. TaxID=2052170 RepID=UPI0025F3C8FA|nr:adenosylcobinamide amidohydrolase [Methanoregula sp.]MCK9632650.1 adenosylcobinamide amidohydrolase [Methanoregula sp.]
MSGPVIRLPLNEPIHLLNGEMAERTSDAVTIRFPGPRNVLSTSWMNGGYRGDLVAIFNHQISLEACDTCHAGNGSVQQYLDGVARNLGMDPETATGLITRAEMENTAIVTESFRELIVTAIVTAGIARNGGRAGDPASYYENGDSCEPVGGTINIIILIDADLPEYAMTRAVMTASEAKAAALQQLMARSIYSSGIATGSGTDMIVIVADPGSSRHLSNTGKHSKLGELIGRVVIRATTTALEMETGLSPASQHDALVRLRRFGVTEDGLWKIAAGSFGYDPDNGKKREGFLDVLRSWAKDPSSVIHVAAALHVVDETGWGLVPKKDACRAVYGIICPTDEPARVTSVTCSMLQYVCMAVVAQVQKEVESGNTCSSFV